VRAETPSEPTLRTRVKAVARRLKALTTALERFIVRFRKDKAEGMTKAGWDKWVGRLPKDELDAAHDQYGDLPSDEGTNGHQKD